MRSTRSRPAERRDQALRNRVRELRTAAELTQAALAERVGVTRQTIIAIERGGYVPSVALALQVARELSEPVERVFWLGPSEGDLA
ncbi:MAG: helix-turn-helix transcriptional regulator [Deinococcales bacterium]|jgi:putative transcriptional regulator